MAMDVGHNLCSIKEGKGAKAIMDISAITQSARVTTDDLGKPVVVLPLSLWQDLLNHLHLQPRQDEQIRAVLQRWEAESDDISPQWWDEFDAELRATRPTFTERDPDTNES